MSAPSHLSFNRERPRVPCPSNQQTYDTALSQQLSQSQTVAADSQLPQDSHSQQRTDRRSRAESINFTDEHRPRFPGACDSAIASVEDGAGNNRPEEEELDQTLLDITAGHQLNLNSLILDIMQSKTDNVLDVSRLDLTAFDANDFA